MAGGFAGGATGAALRGGDFIDCMGAGMMGMMISAVTMGVMQGIGGIPLNPLGKQWALNGGIATKADVSVWANNIFGNRLGKSIINGISNGLLASGGASASVGGMLGEIIIPPSGYDPNTLTAGPGGISLGFTKVDWQDPIATYYETMNFFRTIYQGNKNPSQPYGHWHVNDLYYNTPKPSTLNSIFQGSMSGTISVSQSYTNGVTIYITDCQFMDVDRWRYNFIGGIDTPQTPPYKIVAHAPSYPTRGIITVLFTNISVYNEWLKYLKE